MKTLKVVKNIAIGFILAVATMILHSYLSEDRALELTSMLMILIGSVYYGFALLSNHKKLALIEMIIATVFVFMGVFGLWVSPFLLVVGLFLHGLWDILHHNDFFKPVKVPRWYIPFCASYDITMAGYLLYVYYL